MGDLKAAMSTSHTVQLLPCPFCGGPAGIRGDFGLQGLNCLDHSGECPGAQVSLPAHTPQRRREAIAAWNRRASLPAAVQGEQPPDPNESDPGVLWAEIWRLRAAVAGPAGYATWQAAATAERVRRVKAERDLAAAQASQDSRPASVAPGGQPLAQPNAQEGLVDPVVPTPEPPGATLSPGAASPPHARPLSEWDEDMGSVLWWRFPVDEPPYCGTPNCSDWPGYHTHWTPLVVPSDPAPVGESSSKGGES